MATTAEAQTVSWEGVYFEELLLLGLYRLINPWTVCVAATISCQVPVPVREITWGELEAVSLIVIEPARVPVAVGVNVIEIVHLPFAATDAPQVVVKA